MNGEVKTLFRAEKAVLESGDKEAHITARARLKAGIKEAKRRNRQGMERDLNLTTTCCIRGCGCCAC